MIPYVPGPENHCLYSGQGTAEWPSLPCGAVPRAPIIPHDAGQKGYRANDDPPHYPRRLRADSGNIRLCERTDAPGRKSQPVGTQQALRGNAAARYSERAEPCPGREGTDLRGLHLHHRRRPHLPDHRAGAVAQRRPLRHHPPHRRKWRREGDFPGMPGLLPGPNPQHPHRYPQGQCSHAAPPGEARLPEMRRHLCGGWEPTDCVPEVPVMPVGYSRLYEFCVHQLSSRPFMYWCCQLYGSLDRINTDSK